MVSVANRITIEQIFWQVGVRLPVAHFAGVHLTPLAESERIVEPKVLLFRTKFPNLAYTFLKTLKLTALLPGKLGHTGSSVELVDMNHHASLPWNQIARFRAGVLLPHNVHLIR